LVAAHNLEPTTLGKSDFMAYIKGYMAALKKHLEATNPGRVGDFQKAAAVSIKFLYTVTCSTLFSFFFFFDQLFCPDLGQFFLKRP
jgi:hypothetical protein